MEQNKDHTDIQEILDRISKVERDMDIPEINRPINYRIPSDQ